MKKVLVTGGAGYIGSVIVPMLLNNGYHVRVIDNLFYGGVSLLPFFDNKRFDFVKRDIRSCEAIASSVENMDAVVHLAAVVGDPASKRFPEATKEINYKASLSLIKHCLKQNVKRLIFISTCSNYGAIADDSQGADEEVPLKPLSLYAETKVSVEKYLFQELGKNSPLAWTILRFATAHGLSPRMRFDLTVNEFTYILARGETLELYGEQFWRPYCHVRDFGKCIMTLLGSPKDKVHAEVFNVGKDSENYQKKQIVEKIREYLPDSSIVTVPQIEDPRNYKVSFRKIRNTLGFVPDYEISDTIKSIISAWENGLIGNNGGIINSNVDPRVDFGKAEY